MRKPDLWLKKRWTTPLAVGREENFLDLYYKSVVWRTIGDKLEDQATIDRLTRAKLDIENQLRMANRELKEAIRARQPRGVKRELANTVKDSRLQVEGGFRQHR